MLQPSQDKSKVLYDAVSKDYNVGTYDEFKTKLQSPEKRKAFYEGVGSEYSLGTYEEFDAKIATPKKKDNLQPTAIPPKSGSGTSTGSSGGKNSSGFPEIDMNSVAPGNGVQPDYNAINLAKSKRVKELETSFYASTKDDNDDAVVEQRLQDRKANKGFWNTAEDLTKSAYNMVVDAVYTSNPLFAGLQGAKISEDPLEEEKKQALQEAKRNKITLSEDQKNARAEEIFKKKEKDNLFIDRVNSYLDNLDVEDKNILQQDRLEKGVHLQLENEKKLKVVSAMEIVGNEKIKEYQDVEKQLLELKKNGQEFPKDLFDKYSSLGVEINQISGNIQKYSDQIQKNKSDLGTVEQEFDLFKRTYSDNDNFIGNAIATTGELANGIFGAVNYLASLSPDPITRLNSMRGQQIANKIAGSLEEYRGALRKPVESVESAEGFVNYASDLVANQLPILAVTSTGAGGLAAFGASTTGQTFTKINQEVLSGKANYSPLQMAAIPLLQGGFEVISEIPTLSILKKGSRVISAAANGEIDLIKKSGGELFKGYAKDFGKEFGGEHVTNLGQNFNARYVQGKEDVGLLDNTGRVSKDTAFLTTLLQGSPHVLGAVVKVFQSNNDLGTLDENSRKIIEFSKQLNTEGLTATEKTVIQKQIDKVSAESSRIVASTIGKIGDMPNVVYDEIVSLNSQAGKIKAQAKEINDGKLPNKKELLTSLGQDYKELQIKRSGLIDGSTTAFDLLSGNEQAKRLTQASREITKRDNPDGTKEKFEVKPEDAKELASENYLKEIKEKENEKNSPAPSPEAQPQAEVQKPSEAEKVAEFHLLEGETLVESKQDDKGRTFNTVAITTEKEGLKKTKFLFNRSDKPSDQRNLSSISPEKLSSDFGFEIPKESVPEGFEVARIKEIREGEKSSAATIVLKEINGDESWDADIVITKAKKTPKPQEVSPVEDVVGEKVADIEKRRKDELGELSIVPTSFDSNGNVSKTTLKRREENNVLENEINAKYDAELENLKNEATPPTNPPANGNIRPTTPNVGEVRATEQEIPAKESVPSSVDGGEVKGDASVEYKFSKTPSLKNAKAVSDNDLPIPPKAVENILKNEDSWDKALVGGVKNLGNGWFEVGKTEKGESILHSPITNKTVTIIDAENKGGRNSIYVADFVENNTETPQPKSKGDVEVSDLDHAKDQIAKGVLFWSGDSGAERVNLGISWADIRKGEADIKKGNVNTVPAKRLIEALKTAKEKGGYEYVQGRGGETNKQFVTLDEIQRSTNEYELTDLEQKEVDANEAELVKRHEEYFDSLDEKTQTDILENYENRAQEIDNKGEVQSDSKIGEGKNDVPDGQIREKPTTKEKIAERIKLSDAKVDNIRDAVKGIDSIFGIKIKVDDIEGLNKNGVDIVDVIANIVKQAMAAGIHIDEAISKTIEHLKKTLDFDVNIDEIKERISPKKEAEKNSKDLLSKMTDVPNSGEIGKYISRENIEEGDSEEEFTTNQDYDKLKLIDSLLYGKSIVEEAKVNFGDNYIEELIKNINAIKNVDSKTLHIISLENDLRQRRKESTDVQEKEFLTEQINRLQPISQKLANTVSRALNLNKLRQLSATGVNPNDKSNSIYTKDELETKHEIGKSFGKDIDELQKQYEENIEDFFNEDDFVSEDFELNVPKKRRNNADVKKDISNTLKEMRKALLDVAKGNSAMSSIPYAKQLAVATPYIVKLTSFVAELGIINGKKAVDYVYKEINKVFPGIKKEDVAEIIKKSNTVNKSNLSEEEIFQKKLSQKIAQTEKALENHRAKKPKFAIGANSVWSEELSAIKTELSNLRNENSDDKKKARKLKEKATELLINSGYGKEINVTKKEVDSDGNVTKVKSTKKILDWKRLAGESGSVANISKAIKTALSGQNLSENEISEMVDEMKTAIEEIKTSITEKSLSDLQNRNKIPKTVNVKTEAKNLSELYNQGIFDDNMDEYDIALNRILGFNKFREDQYQDLKDYSKLLAGLFANKKIFGDTNEFMSEDALKTQVAHINKQINEIVNKASMGNGRKGLKGVTPQKVVSVIRDYSDMALLSKLLSLKQAVQNPISGYTERLYQKIGSIFDQIKLTPELKKQLDKGAWNVFKDITVSGSPDLGDSSFSDIRSRKIDDKIRGIKMGKKSGKVRDAVAPIVSGTAYLNGADAYNKVKILEAVFAKAMIDILSNKNYGRNNTMTVKEATVFVSETLTGESFNQALIKADQIIKDTNNEAGKEILPPTYANIYRLAMDVVRDNLTSTGIVDAETVKAVFAGSFKAAGSSLGHESNNPISTIYKNSSQFLDRKIKESVKEKNWGSFALYVSVNLAKNITMPFVSGRFNWAVLGAQITGANLGLSTLVTAYQKNQNKIDFSTEEGRSLKNLTEAVHRKIRHDQTVKRSVVGLSLNVLVISALAASGGDDELEKLLKNSPTLNKVFKWIFPMINLFFTYQKDGKEAAFDGLLDFYSITGDYDRSSARDAIKTLLEDKATDEEISKAQGVIGKKVGKAFDTPIPWRLGKDIKNVQNEITGKEQYKANYNATSFFSGAFQGGFFELIGMREVMSFGHEEERQVSKEERESTGYKFGESQAKIKEYNDLPKSEKEKVDANNRVVSLRQKVAELENFKRAKLTNTPYLVKGAEQPADLSNFDVDAANEAIAKLNALIEEFKSKAGDKYKAPKE